MKYLMFILMVFSFSFSVNALQVKGDYPSIDYGDTIEVQDFALPTALEKVPITVALKVTDNRETTDPNYNGDLNTAQINGRSLPYEVGWQSSETI